MANCVSRILFRLMIYFFIVFWGSFAVAGALCMFLWHPLTFFYQKKREVLPEILQDSSYGTHKYITANGIKFHYVANGTEGKPLMLFLHGYPEFWFSWRFQLPEFGREYYAVAVDLRGYGDTERPAHKKNYKLDTLVQDIAELIPALGYKSCVLVVHDWGGILGWRLVQSHPELVDHFIAMNIPHFKVYLKILRSGYQQVLRSWYVFVCQLPYLPELLMKCIDFKMLEMLFLSKPMGLINKTGFSEEVLEAFKYNFSQPGACTAAMNYYRNLLSAMIENHHDEKIEKPVLVIWGDDDGASARELADEHSIVAKNLVVKHIPNCSHWVQQDRPDLVNQYIQEFVQNDVS